MDPTQPTQPTQPASPTKPTPPVSSHPSPSNNGISNRTLLIGVGFVLASLLLIGAAMKEFAPTSSRNRTIAPTVSILATPTVRVPTATPKPLTRLQRAQPLVHNGIKHSGAESSIKSWTVESDDSTKTFSVSIVLGEQLSTDIAQITMRALAFYIFRDMYTSAKVSIDEVNITFNGPLIDKYGQTSVGLYGVADLTFPTAQKFVWDNLTPRSAWDAYDNAMMRQH